MPRQIKPASHHPGVRPDTEALISGPTPRIDIVSMGLYRL